MTTVTISLPESLKAFAETQAATKGYGDIGGYFRTLLEEAQAREEDSRLEALPLEGLASDSMPLDRAFHQRLSETAEQTLDAALTSLQSSPVASRTLTSADAVDRIRALRQGNVLPDNISIHDMIEEGRA